MSTINTQPTIFSDLLLMWHKVHHRDMPWVRETDPYRIWLSEVLLQQTRVDQGTDYYLRFVEAFPTVYDLAQADSQTVLKLWEGLGYYSRARNLHAAAIMVVEKWEGTFPDDPETLQQLPGVGPYTSRAIASYAFQYPVAVVDGNVNRIVARLFAFEDTVDSMEGKRYIQEKADFLMGNWNSAQFNQAMMDFGSLVCKPARPLCKSCPANSVCQAYLKGFQLLLPIKKAKQARKIRFFQYIMLRCRDRILIRKRTEKDIWQDLYDFPVVETSQKMPWEELRVATMQIGIPSQILPVNLKVSAKLEQTLTHRLIKAEFYICDLDNSENIRPPSTEWISFSDWKKYPFPVMLRKFLSELE